MYAYGYQGNPNLPRFDYKHNFTQHEIEEFIKCASDHVYFAREYIKIVHVDRGLVPFDMWDFQEKMIRTFHDNRFSICKLPRQVGKTTTAVAYLLHYLMFNKNVSVAILANKSSTAREIMSRIQLGFEHLPKFLQQGVVEWNKGSIEFANGSKAIADSTSGSSVRGRTFNIIFLDEFAHVPNNIAKEFFMSTYPTISSGNTTKVIIVSTPKGMNMFYDMWTDAVEGKSLYIPIEVHWSNVPGRDEAWKETVIRNTSEEQFRQEFETEFIGSTATLISPSKLTEMRSWIKTPVARDGFLDVYEEPVAGHTYTLTVDVSEGLGQDYSTFSVIDVTEIPYKQVGKYRNNFIAPMMLPTVVLQAARKYNDAFVLVEINSIGLQVADILHFELAYENLIKVQIKGKQGQQNTPGFTKKIAFGIKTTAQTKNIGCSNIKALIESNKLIIPDADTIMELRSFSVDKKSYKAEEGKKDDLAMTLVHFGWLTSQRYFKETINSNIREALQKEQFDMMDADLVPFGIMDDGLEEIQEAMHANDRDIWFSELKKRYPWDDLRFSGKL